MSITLSAFARITERYPFLEGLPLALTQRLEREVVIRTVPVHTRMFDEHQACVQFPLVLKGTIRVAKSAPSGRTLKLYDVEPGDSCILTSSCLLAERTYPARGEAVTEVEIAIVPGGLFRELMEASEPLRRHIFALFAERLTGLMELVEAVAFRRLDQRLAATLLTHGARVRLTHQQLADELGSAREIVTRILGHFADDALIRSGRQEIEILDADGLKALADARD